MIVEFAEQASDDLTMLGGWIAERADEATANRYLDRLTAACDTLAMYPRRGTPQDGLAPGLRSITFERRVLIAYRVEPNRVLILRLIRTARDIAAQFAPE